MSKKISLILFGILIVAATAILIVISRIEDLGTRQEIKKTILIESFKLFVLGTTASMIVGEYNRQRQRKADMKQFRKGISKALVDAYLKTKRIRWDLRANCKEDKIEVQVYKKAIDKLGEIKSELNVIKYEVRSYDKAFKNKGAVMLEGRIDAMEGLLRQVVNEYFNCNNETSISVENFAALKKFIESGKKADEGKTTGSKFTIEFRTPFKEAFVLLTRNELETTEFRPFA